MKIAQNIAIYEHGEEESYQEERKTPVYPQVANQHIMVESMSDANFSNYLADKPRQQPSLSDMSHLKQQLVTLDNQKITEASIPSNKQNQAKASDFTSPN